MCDELLRHMRNLDLARSLLRNLQAIVDTYPDIESGCKAMASFAADLLDGDLMHDPEAAAILREWGAPRRREPGPLAERLGSTAATDNGH